MREFIRDKRYCLTQGEKQYCYRFRGKIKAPFGTGNCYLFLPLHNLVPPDILVSSSKYFPDEPEQMLYMVSEEMAQKYFHDQPD